MASKKEYLDFVLGQIKGVDITYKKMMGEYLLYANGVLFGGIYDDRLLIKPTEKARELLPNAEYAIPYDGAKLMIFCDFVDDSERMTDFIKKLTDNEWMLWAGHESDSDVKTSKVDRGYTTYSEEYLLGEVHKIEYDLWEINKNKSENPENDEKRAKIEVKSPKSFPQFFPKGKKMG